MSPGGLGPGATPPSHAPGGAPRRVLGVDPGLRATGWGVVERRPEGFRVVACGTVRPDPGAPTSRRLVRVHRGIAAVLLEHAPDAVVVEEAFGGKNVQSAIRLGEARAVCILAAELAERAVHEVPPALVKKAVAGHGQASKETVRDAVLRALSYEGPLPSFDAADALALALTALTRLEATAGLAPGAPLGRRARRGRRRWRASDLPGLTGEP